MKVGALKESKNNEYRASLTPSSIVDLKNEISVNRIHDFDLVGEDKIESC